MARKVSTPPEPAAPDMAQFVVAVAIPMGRKPDIVVPWTCWARDEAQVREIFAASFQTKDGAPSGRIVGMRRAP